MYRTKKIIACIVMLLSIGLKTDAQKQLFDVLNMPMYHARVKLIDEFFARFNGEELRLDVDARYQDRKNSILMLFNLQQFKSKADSLFLEADTFAQTIVEDSVFIDYADTCWYAKVKCHGVLAKKEVDFYLYLVVEQRGEGMHKWVIADAEGTVFNTSRSRQHRELFMMPNAHEQSFSSLSRVTNETNRYIDDFAKNGYEADALSVFLTLTRCGQLRIEYVSDVEFVFFQVPNYVFSVKHFERESMNVGWLISSFRKCKEEEKETIINRICK